MAITMLVLPQHLGWICLPSILFLRGPNCSVTWAATVSKMILPRPELLHLVNQQGRDHSRVKPDNHRERKKLNHAHSPKPQRLYDLAN